MYTRSVFSLREFLWLPKIIQRSMKRVLFSNRVTLEYFARPLNQENMVLKGLKGPIRSDTSLTLLVTLARFCWLLIDWHWLNQIWERIYEGEVLIRISIRWSRGIKAYFFRASNPIHPFVIGPQHFQIFFQRDPFVPRVKSTFGSLFFGHKTSRSPDIRDVGNLD